MAISAQAGKESTKIACAILSGGKIASFELKANMLSTIAHCSAVTE